jgi:hypothetical protein
MLFSSDSLVCGLFVVFFREHRDGIGGGSGVCGVSLSMEDFDVWEKNSEGEAVGEGVLLQLLPFNNRRPMGGLRSVI